MVVVVIVGVLATLAVTQFSASRETALQKEAVANLKLIAAAEKIYRMELLSFTTGNDNADINGRLRLMLPTTSSRWAYTVPTATPNAFCAQAQKVAAPASNWSMDQSLEDPVPGNCP